MAILSECLGCGKEVFCRVNELPYCDKCSGNEAARQKEQQRWNALTVEEKLDELKTRVDGLTQQNQWDQRFG